jgi:hypothetical protein
MKKIIGLIVLITVIGTGFAFAHDKKSGKQHYHQKEYSKKYEKYHKNFKCYKTNAPGFSIIEIKELSGEILLSDNTLPVIKSGNDEIKIILPRHVIQTLKLNSGSKISIKGVELPARRTEAAGEKIIKVFELQHDGRKFMVWGGHRKPGGERIRKAS